DGIRDRNVTGVQTCALPISIVRLPRWSPRGSMLREAGARGTRMRQRGKWKTFPGVSRAPCGLLLPESFVSDSQWFAGARREILRSEERRVGKEWRCGRWW